MNGMLIQKHISGLLPLVKRGMVISSLGDMQHGHFINVGCDMTTTLE